MSELQPQHQALLTASAINPDVATERRYFSATKKTDLIDLGFGKAQALAPALVIPIWGVTGEIVNYQIRPDQPRVKDGRTLKYETPRGSRLHLDVHPWAKARLGENGDILIVTEGARKSDSSVSRGLTTIDLLGVWGWRGRNELDGFTRLPDWEDIHLKGREVHLCFDSDVMRKPEVHASLVRLKAWLESRRAEVWIEYLPEGKDGAKIGLDDYFAAGHTTEDLFLLATRELCAPPRTERQTKTAADFLANAPAPDLIIPAPFLLSEKATSVPARTAEGEAGYDEPIAFSPILITGTLRDVDDRTESFRLSWLRPNGWRHLAVERGVALDSRKLVELASQGFPVASDNAKDVVGYLHRLEAANLDQLPVAQVSSHMGWQGDRGSNGFLWGKTHLRSDGQAESVDLMTVSPDAWNEGMIAFRGAASGDEQVAEGYHAGGSFDHWRQAVSILKDFPRPLLVFYTGFVPSLLEIIGCPNFIVDQACRTTVGKTTSSRAAASIWGNPDERSPSAALFAWDNTRVSMERLCALLTGLPLILDDTKRVKDTRLIAETLYLVANGRGKGRGNLKGVARTKTWRTVLISNGEAPATSFTEDGGTRTRCLVLRGLPFGRDDGDTRRLVEKLNRDLINNYGHAGPAFINYLLQRRDRWDGWRNAYLHGIENYANSANSSEGGRLAGYVSAIALAARIAHESLDLGWDYHDPLKGIWKEIAGEVEDAAGELKALQDVINWAYANEHSFFGRAPMVVDAGERRVKLPMRGWLGRWDAGDDWEWLAIYPHELRARLTEWGYHPEGILEGWKQRGWLACDSGRVDKRIRFDGGRQWFIAITREAIVPE